MITGEIRNKVDQIWNTFWSGGVSNPLSVIEQITYPVPVREPRRCSVITARVNISWGGL